jgi:hypothetical protein
MVPGVCRSGLPFVSVCCIVFYISVSANALLAAWSVPASGCDAICRIPEMLAKLFYCLGGGGVVYINGNGSNKFE